MTGSPSPWRFSKHSEEQLATVRPKLQAVMRRALELSAVDFGIGEGRRTEIRQSVLLAAGATRTLKSKHLTGSAVDVIAFVGGRVHWDWPLYREIAKAVKAAAAELHTEITWGGDWQDFQDGPHFELVDHAN